MSSPRSTTDIELIHINGDKTYIVAFNSLCSHVCVLSGDIRYPMRVEIKPYHMVYCCVCHKSPNRCALTDMFGSLHDFVERTAGCDK